MKKIVEFLNACGPFFVLTVNGNAPAGRPFGAVMEYEGNLYIATSHQKPVYKQLNENENVQIVALKPGTREWVRVSGKASECIDLTVKQKMLTVCPVLNKHYDGADAENYHVFKIQAEHHEFY